MRLSFRGANGKAGCIVPGNMDDSSLPVPAGCSYKTTESFSAELGPWLGWIETHEGD